MSSAKIILGFLAFAIIFGTGNADDDIKRKFIKEHVPVVAGHYGGKVTEARIEKLNHFSSIFPNNEVWFSSVRVDIEGKESRIETFYLDLKAKDLELLPMFNIVDDERTEIPEKLTKDLLATRAARFLLYEAKLYNEPDEVTENGLNIHSFKMKNGDSFRGHLLSRNGDEVVIEMLPTHVSYRADEFCEADQTWLESAKPKLD